VVRTLIEASAPIRICDNGGWTDSWFGGPGRVLNIAVTPGVEVTIGTAVGPERVVLDVEPFADRYAIEPGASRVGRHPLLESAIDRFPPPDEVAVEVRVHSPVPAGCGAGTSAAVAVALVGALVAARGERLTSREVASVAHRLETETLGESGVQDQLSAAIGGINYLEIDTYPEATVHSLPGWEELDRQLTLVFLGHAHNSSDLHREVIEHLGSHQSAAFPRLRAAATAARDAVLARDLQAFGQTMIDNTEAQRSLHPALVGADAGTVIEMAAAHRALGWKVNGAGGDGGSVTVLTATSRSKHAFEQRVVAADRDYQVLPVHISSVGLEVRGSL
jgi:D-glycero-alpha-D-manno-heptose-7-phosphate kinase